MQTRPDAPPRDLMIVKANYLPPPEATRVELMVIDGNRDGRLVLFPHDEHVAKLGEKLGEKRSCEACHHQNLPFGRNSACGGCHRDMYLESDTFAHTSHVSQLGGNAGCVRCHDDPGRIKSREATTGCLDCHTDMVAAESRIQAPDEGMTGYATGYMDAMHGLCIKCHEEQVETEPATYGAEFATCTSCHRDADGSRLRELAPYVVKEKTIAGIEEREESG
jgi:hypothetical protein